MIFLQAMDPGMVNLLFIGAMFAVLYFFMIRPQAKKAKEQEKFSTDLAKGDKVVTTSGIHGRVKHIEGGIVTLEVYKNTHINISSSAISKDFTEQFYGDTES